MKKEVLATRPNKLHAYKLTISPLTFERYISFPFRVFFFVGGGEGILMIPHHYMPDSSPRPAKDLPFTI